MLPTGPHSQPVVFSFRSLALAEFPASVSHLYKSPLSYEANEAQEQMVGR